MKEIEEILLKRGYKEYDNVWEKDEHTEYKRFFSKRVKSESVCDLNDKLTINVTCWKISLPNSAGTEQIDVSVIAEKDELWYDLKVYSILHSEFKERINEIEKTLVKLFNQI